MTNVQKIIGLVLGLAALIGLCFQLDRTYAKAEELVKVAKRLDQKIMADKAFNIRERIYQLERMYPKNPPVQVQNEIRYLKQELRELDEKMRRTQ